MSGFSNNSLIVFQLKAICILQSVNLVSVVFWPGDVRVSPACFFLDYK